MRIEFCEADVLEAFDAWSRALGLAGAEVAEKAEGAEEDTESAEGPGNGALRKGSLAAHIQRTVARLLAPKGLAPNADYDAWIRRIIEELDDLAVQAKGSRGDARTRILERLDVLDRELLEMARRSIDDRTSGALRSEADAELAGFAGRMPAESLARARQLAFERFLRDALKLPVLSYE